MISAGELSVQEAFGRALADLWARDGIAPQEPRALASTVAASFAAGDAGVSMASDLLVRTGVRERWNEVLRRDRAAVLAKRIHSLVKEPLLDVLAGDGSVCCALSDLGVARLAATERPGDYPESLLPPHVPFRPLTDTLDLAQFDASTALLSAVLHHEPDPVGLLDMLAEAGIPRWIVVENCVTPEFSRPFHQFADRFFNNCLNEFGVHCGDQHRTLDEWTNLLAHYGSIGVVDRSFTVPGIPFPYSLLVVSRDVDEPRA
jgi:hypothetical protein